MNYLFLTFLVLLNILNFVDRQLIASFANDIVEELQLTDLQFGLITGLAFTFFYSVAGLLIGSVLDTGNRPRLLALGLTVWSGFTVLTGRATGFVSIALPRMFIGVGESIQTPASISMLSDRFPASKMGMASGIYYMGVPLGVGISLLIVGFLGPAIGWRKCFYLMGVIGLVFAVGMVLLMRETPERLQQIAAAKAARKSRGREMLELIGGLGQALRTNRALSWTIAGGVTTHFILGAGNFDQLWLVREVGYDRTEIAIISGMIFIVAGSLGNVFGGIGSDLFQSKLGQTRPLFLCTVLLALTPLVLLYRVSEAGSVFIYIGLFSAAFTLGALYGPTFATVQELAPQRSRATAIALYILLLNLVGLGLGSLIGGLSVDLLRAAGYAKPYTWTLIGLHLLSALAIPMFYIAHRHYRRGV